MGDVVEQHSGPEQFVVAFEEAIGALPTVINRDKDAFAATLLALEIYYQYQKKKMDFVDILEKEIYPKYGF